MRRRTADEQRAYRQRQREALGEEEYKREQAEKRKERRARKKLLEGKKIENTDEYKQGLNDIIEILKRETLKPKLPLPETIFKKKVGIEKTGGVETCNDLLEQVYKAKRNFLANQKPSKTIKRKSVEQQFTKVQNLYNKMTGKTADCSNFTFLKDTDNVIKFINEHWKTDNSRASQIQAISSILQAINGYEEEYKIYSKYSTEKRKEITTNTNKCLLTEKEKANILPWNDLKNVYKKVKNSRDKALVALYTLLPPRRVEDVSLLTLADKLICNNKYNYLVIDTKTNKPKELVYNNYKTDKSYKRVIISLNTELSNILQQYITDYGLKVRSVLFGTPKGGYYRNFSDYITKVFKKYVNKNITVNLIRHSFITDFLKGNHSKGHMDKIARQMGHSFNTQASYKRLDL